MVCCGSLACVRVCMFRFFFPEMLMKCLIIVVKEYGKDDDDEYNKTGKKHKLE